MAAEMSKKLLEETSFDNFEKKYISRIYREIFQRHRAKVCQALRQEATP
jgi:hypothetical protein